MVGIFYLLDLASTFSFWELSSFIPGGKSWDPAQATNRQATSWWDQGGQADSSSQTVGMVIERGSPPFLGIVDSEEDVYLDTPSHHQEKAYLKEELKRVQRKIWCQHLTFCVAELMASLQTSLIFFLFPGLCWKYRLPSNFPFIAHCFWFA